MRSTPFLAPSAGPTNPSGGQRSHRGRRSLAALAALALASGAALVAPSVVAAAASRPSVHAAPLRAHGAPSCTDSWNGGSGMWSDDADWSAGEPDGSDDAVVCITVPGSSVTLTQLDTGVGELVLGGATGSPCTLAIVSTDTSEGLFQVSADSQINPTGVLDLSSASDDESYVADLTGDSGATIVNDGLIESSGDNAELDSALTNDADGTVSIDGFLSEGNQTVTVLNQGHVTIDAGSKWDFEGQTLTQEGSLAVNGTFDLHGAQLNMNGGTETGAPITLVGFVELDDTAGTGSVELLGVNSIAGTIPAGQTVTLLSTSATESSTDLDDPGVTNRGTLVLDVSYAGSSDRLGGATLTNDGTFDIETVGAGGQTAAIDNGAKGVINVTGTGYEQDGPLVNYGTINVGKGADLELTDGVFTNHASSVLHFVETPTGSSDVTTYGPAVVTLAGRLETSNQGKVAKGTVEKPLDFSSNAGSTITGKFSSFAFLGAAYTVTYKTAVVELTAGAPFTAKAVNFTLKHNKTATVTVAKLAGLPATGKLTAAIRWTSTSSSSGKVTVSHSKGTVTGTHEFHTAGRYAVTVTITDSDGTVFVVTDQATVS